MRRDDVSTSTSRVVLAALTASAVGVFLVSGSAAAQATNGPPLASFDIQAARLKTTSPIIDGEVDEIEWEGAAGVASFIQDEPRRGDQSDVRTEVLILHDAGRLYVAFRAWDADPITAQLTQRDADLFRDDAVVVVLDTTFDRRSSYYFITNALGTQGDGRIVDDGRAADGTWDAPWQSTARRTDYGWSAEFSIPLSALRYTAGENRTWGVNFGRSRRRTLELSFWSGPLDSQWRVSQAGRLLDVNVPPPLDRIQVVPYGLTRLQEGLALHRDSSSQRISSCDCSIRRTPPSIDRMSRRCSCIAISRRSARFNWPISAARPSSASGLRRATRCF